MLDRSSTGTIGIALALALTMLTIGGARAADEAKYPDWKGQWARFAVKLPTQPSHDQTKPWGFGQEAPLTPEYKAVLEASIADQAKGGLGNFPTTLGPPCRHAAHDDGVSTAGIRRHAGDDLYFDRLL